MAYFIKKKKIREWVTGTMELEKGKSAGITLEWRTWQDPGEQEGQGRG